jgi:hypothetical protein
LAKDDERILLGQVSVDSGQLILVDSCYLQDWKDGKFQLNQKPDKDY